MPTTRHKLIPDARSGYFLNPKHGFFSIVAPREATNLVKYPSIENDSNATGYTGVGSGSFFQVTTSEQRYGLASLAVTPGSSGTAGVAYGDTATHPAASLSLTARVQYTFSVSVKGIAGIPYCIYFANALGQRQSAKKSFKASGRWQRVSVTFTAYQSGNHQLHITKDGSSSTGVFYVDGLQCEVGGPTTYLDGDQKGYVKGQAAYRWNGTPHASTSTRILQTRSGGEVVRLRDIGFNLLAIIGLGLAPVANLSTDYAVLDGSLYQNTRTLSRNFTLIGAVFGKHLASLQQVRQQLINLIKPDLVFPKQPLLMLYEYADECGNPSGETLEIVCNYSGGLEGNTDNLYQENIGMQFTMFAPQIFGSGNKSSSLAYQNVLAVSGALIRNASGVWSSVNLSSFSSYGITEVIIGRDGKYYFGGFFVSGATRYGVISYDPSTSTLSNLNSSITAATVVSDLTVSPEGNIVAVGTFSSMSGLASTNKIAQYNISTAAWQSIAIGFTGTQIVAAQFDNSGDLYVGGLFSNVGGVAMTNIGKRSSAGVWSALSTGLNSDVYDLALGKDGYIYAGGNFTSPNRITYWDGSAFQSLSTGADAVVTAIGFSADGTLYLGGQFTTLGGVSANLFGKWNGTSFYPLGTSVGGANVNYIFPIGNQILFITDFTSVSGVSLIDGVFYYDGYVFAPIDISLPGNKVVQSGAQGPSGELVLANLASGTAVSSTITSVTVEGTSIVRPTYTLTGPGTVRRITNQTTNQDIYFNNLTLLQGEVATLTLEQGNISFTSNFRGNLASYISPASELSTFHLQPGVNSLLIFVEGTNNASTSVYVSWREAYTSIDGAIPLP